MKEAHAAERWSPPLVGSLTCNVDANLTGAGVCVWDHHGRVVATRTDFRGRRRRVGTTESFDVAIFVGHAECILRSFVNCSFINETCMHVI